MIVIPKPLIEVLEEEEYECAFLLGEVINEIILVTSLAFVRAYINKTFRCVTPPLEGVIGVIHSHEECISSLDLEDSKGWNAYVVVTRRGVKGFVKGREVEVKVA